MMLLFFIWRYILKSMKTKLILICGILLMVMGSGCVSGVGYVSSEPVIYRPMYMVPVYNSPPIIMFRYNVGRPYIHRGGWRH